MKDLTLGDIKFISFIKVFTLTAITTGAGFGVLFFIVAVSGGDATVSLGETQITGIPAGLISLIFAPIVSGIFGGLLSVFSFLPFKLTLTILDKRKQKEEVN